MAFSNFKLLRPRISPDALGLLSEHRAEVRILAGGTDLLPSMRQRLFEPQYVMDLRLLSDLKRIRETEHGVEIGALTTLR